MIKVVFVGDGLELVLVVGGRCWYVASGADGILVGGGSSRARRGIESSSSREEEEEESLL